MCSMLVCGRRTSDQTETEDEARRMVIAARAQTLATSLRVSIAGARTAAVV
jgi:hypothetical protein